MTSPTCAFGHEDNYFSLDLPCKKYLKNHHLMEGNMDVLVCLCSSRTLTKYFMAHSTDVTVQMVTLIL